MLPANVKELIARLDPGSFTAFVEGLMTAEAARLRMPPTNLVMSDALTENDEGIDARLVDVPGQAPDGPASSLPAGTVGLQLKATKGKAPSAFDLPLELRKPGPRRLLAGGGAYVLVSSQDLNDAQRARLEQALADEAAAVIEEVGSDVSPRTFVWDAQALVGMCLIHPSPVMEIGLVDFGAARSLEELLTSLRADDRPFQTDAARDTAVTRLRERARSVSDDPQLMWLHGDPGAGKTRTIAHGLDTDDLRDIVLYVEGAEGLQRLLTTLIRNAASRGILFVDEVDDHDVTTALRSLGGLNGRWRIVAVKSHTERRAIAEGGRNIVLPPLDPEATRRLVEEHAGLPERLARMVAEVAAGFPELALRLADELRANPDLDLVRLARLPQPAELLARLLGDEEVRRHLAPLALFTAVGFEEELRYELEAVAEGFNLEPASIERYCEEELERGRFVSRAGRYRLVSPLLVAIWLATDLIERTPAFEEKIFALPEPLQEAFIRQLDYFGPGAAHLPAALARVLRDERFRRPEAFSEAAGRFLRASAAIIPAQVADAIGELLASSTPEDLLRLPRRDLVWTLQILLWWPETWETAAGGLYLLAQHENESWSNSATGEFPTAFAVYLSGSTVPYRVRAAWLERTIAEAGPEQIDLVANAAAAGLRGHHFRTSVGFLGGGEPTDWQPESSDEYIESRRTAWRLLLAVRDRAGAVREAVTKRLSDSLRIAYGSTLALDVDSDLRGRRWSAQERADLASGLRDVLQYEDLPADLRNGIQALHDWLVGDDLEARLQIIVATPLWNLHAERRTLRDVPPLLEEVADELAANQEEGLEVALDTGRELEQQETRYVLFRLLSQRLGAERVGGAALARPDWPALSAALSVADQSGEAAWVDTVLMELAAADPERVPEMLTFTDLNDSRVELILTLVEDGRATGSALSRLLFGARIRDLNETQAVRVLQAVRGAENIEAALGMLDQWLDDHGSPSAEIRRISAELALSATDDPSAMTNHYLERLVDSDVIEPAALLDFWETRMINRSGLAERLDHVLTDRVLLDPTTAAPRVLGLVRPRGDDMPLGIYSSTDLLLLSRLAAATSPESVWQAIQAWPERDLRLALHHMNWSGLEPDALVREFLVSERLAELENEATVCFFNTLGVVTGPYYLALERELARARQWREAVAGTSAERWADELVSRYETDIDWHRQREQEERLRLR